MPRKRRFSLPGVPVHVVQRGNNRQAVFFDENDYRAYLEWLSEAAGGHGCSLGSNRFRKQIEQALGIKVGYSKRGRPTKPASKSRLPADQVDLDL